MAPDFKVDCVLVSPRVSPVMVKSEIAFVCITKMTTGLTLFLIIYFFKLVKSCECAVST